MAGPRQAAAEARAQPQPFRSRTGREPLEPCGFQARGHLGEGGFGAAFAAPYLHPSPLLLHRVASSTSLT